METDNNSVIETDGSSVVETDGSSVKAGFALPVVIVAIVAKCEEKIFLAQKNFIWRKQVAKKKFSQKIGTIWAVLCHLIAN